MCSSGSALSERPRPESLPSETTRVRTGHGNLFVTVTFDAEEGRPFEVFTAEGHAGSCQAADAAGLASMISLALRSGIAAKVIVALLRGIVCCPHWAEGKQTLSRPDAIAQVLEKYCGEGGGVAGDCGTCPLEPPMAAAAEVTDDNH